MRLINVEGDPRADKLEISEEQLEYCIGSLLFGSKRLLFLFEYLSWESSVSFGCDCTFGGGVSSF